MIVRWDDIAPNSDNAMGRVLSGVNRSVLEDPMKWRGHLPDLQQLLDASKADTALLESFQDGISAAGSESGVMRYIGAVAMGDFIDGMRVSLGQVAMTAGILLKEISSISTIVNSNRSDIVKAFDVVDKILSSQAFEMALNLIGAIPIVGWVINIIANVAKTIAGVVSGIKDSKEAYAKKRIAESLTIPLGSIDFDRDVDDAVTRNFFSLLRGDPQKIILPAYDVNRIGMEGMFDAAGVYDKEGDSFASGWVIQGQPSGAFGYVPGSDAINRSLFFPAGHKGGGCASASMRDIGSFYTTSTNLAVSLWSQVAKPGPSMYMFNPGAAKVVWESYMEKLFGLAQNIMKGWVCAPTGIEFKDKFRCTSKAYGIGACSSKKRGDTMKLPNDFGRSPHTFYYAYLCELFFGLKNPYSPKEGGLTRLPHLPNASFDNSNSYYTNNIGSKFFRADYIDYDRSVPSDALTALYDRQRATLQSINCMYVNGDDPARFPAFYNSNLKNLWGQSVTAILQSNDWRKVTFADMPEGDAKDAFYQLAKSKGISDVENYKPNLHMQMATATVLGDPEPPPMPGLKGAELAMLSASVQTKGSRKKGKKKSSNMPLLLAAGALGILMMNKK